MVPGNLLGKQQSGNIAAVGLDMYLQMVEHAVQQLKGQEVEEEYEPTLHLSVSAYIPEDYVDDTHQRLGLYKRLSSSERIGDLALLHGETQDRYGPLPDPVERLYEVMQVKLLAKSLKLESVEIRGKAIVIQFHHQAKLPEKGFSGSSTGVRTVFNLFLHYPFKSILLRRIGPHCMPSSTRYCRA